LWAVFGKCRGEGGHMKNPFCGWGMDIFWNHTIYVGEIGSRLFQIAASLILALKCRGNCCLFGSFKNLILVMVRWETVFLIR